MTSDAGNVNSLAEKILEIAGDTQFQKLLAQNVRNTVEERFTLTRMVDKVEQCLESINRTGA